MKKLLFIILCIVSFFVCFLFLFFISSLKKQQPSSLLPYLPPAPTPIPINQTYKSNPNQPLSLVKITPENNAQNVSLDQVITLTFTKSVPQNAIAFSIAPSLPVRITTHENTVTITPQQLLLPNLEYTYFVSINGVPTYALTFSTIQNPSLINHSLAGSPDFASEVQNEINKYTHADRYLADHTPYNGNTIVVGSDYSSMVQQNVFTVLYYKNEQTAQMEFMAWATSLGLTKQQIELLQITYQPANPGF